MLRFAFALLPMMALAACSSLPVGGGSVQRAVDPLNDDLGTLVLAFDLPRGVEPIERESMLRFDAGPSSGGRHLSVGLVRVDAGDATSTLPPPGSQRLYYLFGFTESDRSALRDAQTWARGQGTIPTVALAPRFCRVTPIDPALSLIHI